MPDKYLHKHKESWVISQHWSDLLFVNYKVPEKLLKSLIPSYLTLDTFEGVAYTSIVPFRMSKVKFPFLSYVPFSELTELNLRAYVKFNGQRGIYFFTLDSNHVLANFIARNFFHLPYCYKKISLSIKDGLYQSSSPDLDLSAEIKESLTKGEFENFLVERYYLFTDNGKEIFRGQVFHKPWDLYKVSQLEIKENLHERFHIKDVSYHSSFMAKELDVYFKPFEKVGNVNGR